MYVFIPSLLSHSPHFYSLRLSQSSAPYVKYSSFPLVSYFTHGGISVIATLSILSHPLLPLQILLKIVSVNLTTLQNSCSHICFCCLVADLVTPIACSTSEGQASLSFTISQNWLRLMSIESVMLSNHLILCCPFSSCPQSFPGSGSFPVSPLFALGGQNSGASASASVFLLYIQGWFPLGLTGLIPLQSKGLISVLEITKAQRS